jgi:hypothetical protein
MSDSPAVARLRVKVDFVVITQNQLRHSFMNATFLAKRPSCPQRPRFV